MKILLILIAVLLPSFAFPAELCPDLTTAQKMAGYLSWKGTLQVVGSMCLAMGLLFLFSGLIRKFLGNKKLIELLFWVIAIAGMTSGLYVPAGYAAWLVFAGAMAFPGAWLFSSKLRRKAALPQYFVHTLTLIWATLAILYQFNEIGFLATLGLLILLGLKVHVTPFAFHFGFQSEDKMVRGMTAGFVITAAYAIATIAGGNLGIFEVFRSGALWLGSFTWFLGILIVTSFWYKPGAAGYAWRQALALVAFSVAISVGMLFGLRELTTIASAFLLFYLASKVIEIPAESHIFFGLKLLTCGGLLFGAWTWLQNNQQLVVKYLAL